MLAGCCPTSTARRCAPAGPRGRARDGTVVFTRSRSSVVAAGVAGETAATKEGGAGWIASGLVAITLQRMRMRVHFASISASPADRDALCMHAMHCAAQSGAAGNNDAKNTLRRQRADPERPADGRRIPCTP